MLERITEDQGEFWYSWKLMLHTKYTNPTRLSTLKCQSDVLNPILKRFLYYYDYLMDEIEISNS